MPLVLIVLAAKETLAQFANRPCTHRRQGSTRDPNRDKSDPGALLKHYRYRPCSTLFSVSAVFKRKESPFPLFLTHKVARERSTPPGSQLSLTPGLPFPP